MEKKTSAHLQKWSQVSFHLPPIEDIREIHIYDFDNTGLSRTASPSYQDSFAYAATSIQHADAEQTALGQCHNRTIDVLGLLSQGWLVA